MEEIGIKPTDIPFNFDHFDGINPGMGLLALVFYSLMFLMAFDVVRKASYKVFIVVHQFWIFATIFAMLHFNAGSSNRLGFLPGLILQIIDKISLFLLPVLSAETHAIVNKKGDKVDAVRLHVPLPSGNASSMNTLSLWNTVSMVLSGNCRDKTAYMRNGFRPGGDAEFDSFSGLGHYYFINIPALGIEFHPFSVSEIVEGGKNNDSFPGEAIASLSFHIQPLGEKSWTGRLASLVMAGESSMTAKLRGPYGSLSLNLGDYRDVILLAGGIGVTPFLPVLDRIRYWVEHDKDGKFPRLRSVTVLWTVKQEKAALLEVFAERINTAPSKASKISVTGIEMEMTPQEELFEQGPAPQNYRKVSAVDMTTGGIRWDSRFFVTADPGEKVELQLRSQNGEEIQYNKGRPDLKRIMDAFPHDEAIRSSDTCALLCGPVGMTTAAAKFVLT